MGEGAAIVRVYLPTDLDALYIDYGNPLKRLWIPAFAGMTSSFISGF